MEKASFPLNLCHVMKTDLVINRVYMFVLGFALLALFYYRFTTFLCVFKNREIPLLPYALICLSELVFAFLWVMHQGFRWRPVKSTVYPQRLPEDEKLPPVDVFICTADPGKEPSVVVMNTVLSAMALDYPPDKLAVYLSDDGGSSVTRRAIKATWEFSKHWLPFCRKYKVDTRCPQAYFSAAAEKVVEYAADKKEMEERYHEFKKTLEKDSVNASSSVSSDHEPLIEVLSNSDSDAVDSNHQRMPMPILVYVAREKRPSHPHNSKAGALNVLIRVSAVISNAPYMLVLDCDHFCNDPTSARQAMCFFMDPQISPKLAFVQFPQSFYNVPSYDIYDARLCYFLRRWNGLNGLQGPAIAGSNLYLKRNVLYNIKNIDLAKKSLGPSNELVKSVYLNSRSDSSEDGKIIGALAKELRILASCTYDNQSRWGKEVGFIYVSLVEDAMTSITLHGRGWISVFLDPPNPCFLGMAPTSLSDIFVQHIRWSVGLMQIFLSKAFARVFMHGRMRALQIMCYTALTADPVYAIPFYILSTVPQICLVHGIPLYPKVSDLYFSVFAFVFVASQLKHVQEVVWHRKSMAEALYELRFWMMKSGTCYMYAILGAVMDWLGLHEAQFNLTSKVGDEQHERRFEAGVYDFQAAPALIAPLCSLYILNVAALVIGLCTIVTGRRTADELFAQAVVPLFGVIVNYPLLEGMVLRKDGGRVAPAVCAVSAVVAVTALCFGSVLLVY